MNIHPPKWADRFLRWYCSPRFLEEIEGDIYELFDRRVEDQSPRMARIKFIWDVLRFFRWSNINRTNSKYTTMIRFTLFTNYLKLGMRNIRRNLASSMINIFGMAIAICFAISIFIFTDIQLNMDSFHSNGDRIYQITNYVDQDGNENLWSDSPIMLGPTIAEDHPSIESFARIEYRSAVVKYKSDVFDELIVFTDPSFFEMFDFEMISGNRRALYDKSNVVISRNMAIKYFNDEDPIGKELSFKFSNGQVKRFFVDAVLEEYPYNTSISFSFYIPMDNFFDLDFDDTQSWSYMTDATFVMLNEDEQIGSIYDSFDRYLQEQHESNPEWKVRSYVPLPLDELSVKSYMIEGSVSGGGHPAGRVTLLIIAAFLLGMACFNFMNISVVSASKRLKEIALRKVMGSVRKEIIYQFMTENLLTCFFALLVGTLLSYFLLVPWFDVLIPEMDVKFRTNDPFTLIYFMLGLLAIVGTISGAYPSFYISKFDAITIFKGKEKFGAKNIFSKIMLGFQFFLAIMTIVGCFIMTEQSIYLGEKDWGYDPEGTMSVYVNDQEQYDLLKNEIINHPAVINHTSSNVLIGRGITKVSLEIGDKQVGVRSIGASENYFDTFQLRMLEGRPLTDRAEDQQGNVVVNEKFVKAMGWESGVGQTFTYDSMIHKVIGVVKDFHYYDFFSEIDPVMIRGLKPENVRYLTVQVDPSKISELEQYTREAWMKIAPDDPFDRVFQEDVFAGFYQENQTNITILLLITGIAIVLACLGLYGLLSFNVQGKLKEFSVRKVLGAEPKSIVRIVGNQYIWVLIISFLIGAPLGSFGMMNLVMTIFPEPKAVSALPFIVAMLIILITLIITVAGQINKAINVNPAELLRSE
ncbi:ABC transporter permease [Ekhidna sp.]|uniref:ABC transporter permease n=1 Tax=Ekhidna sp. TaxID=2608089 RepID=UPI00329A732F